MFEVGAKVMGIEVDKVELVFQVISDVTLFLQNLFNGSATPSSSPTPLLKFMGYCEIGVGTPKHKENIGSFIELWWRGCR